MNSFNHYAYGAIEEWIMSHNLGIQRDENRPGYKHILMQPKIDDTFSFVKGGFCSVYGDIASAWEIKPSGTEIEFTIPANTPISIQPLDKDGKQHGQPEAQKRKERR